MASVNSAKRARTSWIDADADEDAEEGEDVVEWGDLPVDVVGKIQAQLPLVSLLRSQAVCRAWKEAMVSPLLLQERRESGGGAQDLMLFAAGSAKSDGRGPGVDSYVYDSASNRWYQVQLRIPPCLRKHHDHLNALGALLAGERPDPEDLLLQVAPWVSASGGVLMSVRWPWWARHVVVPYVGNPVAGSWTRLPALPRNLGLRQVRGVFVDAMARCFKLVVVQNTRTSAVGREPVPTFVFDSTLGSWSETSMDLPRASESFSRLSGQHGVFVGTVLYCSVGNHDLLTYDLERASWSSLAVAKPTNFVISYVDLFNVRDRLLCLAVGEDHTVKPRRMCMQIWRLDFACMAWTAVGAMPAPMFAHISWILAHEHIKVVVAAQDQVVYITLGSDLKKIVALDLKPTPSAWRWLPSCPNERLTSKSLQCMDPWLQLSN